MPITTKNVMNDQVSALFFSTLLNCSVNSLSLIILCAFPCIPLQLYWHYVLLAVHFYCCLDAPCSCVQSRIFLGRLPVRCLVTDPLLLCWFAQPFVLLVCVYHVLVCSFVLHYFIMWQIKNLLLKGHRCYVKIL